jgi:hypothetical protein
MLWMKRLGIMQTPMIVHEVPIFMFIPKSMPLRRIRKRSETFREWGITSLMIEVEGRRLPEELTGLDGSLEIVGKTNDESIFPNLLDPPLTGIAIQPEKVKSLLEHRNRILTRDMGVFLTHEERGMENADALIERFSNALVQLRDTGLTKLSCCLFHEDITRLFALCRALAGRCGVCSVVGLTPRRDTQKMLYETALQVGCLFVEDLAEAVLVPAPAGFRGAKRLTEITRETLGILGRYPRAFSLISCPTCGRCQMDIPRMAGRVHRLLRTIESRYRSEGVHLERAGGITVAVMGCNVNGPGEARGADIGIAGGKRGTGTIFREGEPVATLSGNKLFDEFEHLLQELVETRLKSKAASVPAR